MNYTFSTNITVKELKEAIDFAEDNDLSVIGLHIMDDNIKNGIYVSKIGEYWRHTAFHKNITDISSM